MITNVLFLILILLCFYQTVIMSLKGLLNRPRIKWLIEDRFPVLVVLIMYFFGFIMVNISIGEFYRGEISPVPWIAFSESFAKHGLFDAIYSFFTVLMTDLWLFWTPSHHFIMSKEKEERVNGIYIRLFNFAVGLLLTIPSNPIIRLIILFASGHHPIPE
jgi:hypothetical protein